VLHYRAENRIDGPRDFQALILEFHGWSTTPGVEHYEALFIRDLAGRTFVRDIFSFSGFSIYNIYDVYKADQP
jgi:hypothetical protein